MKFSSLILYTENSFCKDDQGFVILVMALFCFLMTMEAKGSMAELRSFLYLLAHHEMFGVIISRDELKWEQGGMLVIKHPLEQSLYMNTYEQIRLLL